MKRAWKIRYVPHGCSLLVTTRYELFRSCVRTRRESKSDRFWYASQAVRVIIIY